MGMRREAIMRNRYEQLIEDIVYRLKVCFPQYRISAELWEQHTTTFAAFHLSQDGRDTWRELIADSGGDEREIELLSFHLQTPLPHNDDAKALQYFRGSITNRFIQAWYAELLTRAGIEP
jgi:hypothetical protein